MTRRFEYSEDNSNKFWEISQSGTEVRVRFGRFGTVGQTKTKTFPDEAAAVNHMDELIAQKIEKGYREVSGESAPSPAGAVAEPTIDLLEAWKKIEETVRFLDPDGSRSLPAGASLEDLQRAEKEIGVRFPEAFKRSYLLHNGSNRICVCPNAFFLPLMGKEGSPAWGILELWRQMCEIGEQFKDERSNPEGPIRNVYWNPKWVPFADNECGDYVCLTSPRRKAGRSGRSSIGATKLGPCAFWPRASPSGWLACPPR
jgi:predicted DNA-binding WGR domain protein/cell wall assembly regulator SMI1